MCVGAESIADLEAWIAERARAATKAGRAFEQFHTTRMVPKRVAEILDGGSLYWVIKGFVLVRQRVIELRADAKDDGTACCGIVLDAELVATRPHPRRAFQGWRYLEAADAPRDVKGLPDGPDDMPPRMRKDLRELRLIDW